MSTKGVQSVRVESANEKEVDDMAVRPFYIEAQIDGRKTDLCGGTKSKDGDHTISLHQRSNGEITTPFKIRQYSIYPPLMKKLGKRNTNLKQTLSIKVRSFKGMSLIIDIHSL